MKIKLTFLANSNVYIVDTKRTGIKEYTKMAVDSWCFDF